MFRNCIFCALFSVLLFPQTLTPWHRKSGNNKIYLAGVSNLLHLWITKHKLASPSLLIILTLQYISCSSRWLDGYLFYFFTLVALNRKFVRMLLTNSVDCRRPFLSLLSLLSWKKSHSRFEITTYAPWQYGSEKGVEVEKILPDNNVAVTWRSPLKCMAHLALNACDKFYLGVVWLLATHLMLDNLNATGQLIWKQEANISIQTFFF